MFTLLNIKPSNDGDYREEITGVKDIENNVLTIESESSWDFKSDVWRTIKKKFPSLSIYYQAEEFGCDVFNTNDPSGKFFPTKWALDWNQEGNEKCEGIDYFNSDKELLDFCSSTFGKTFDSTQSVASELSDILEEENEDNYAVLHEISVADWDYDLWDGEN